MSLCVRACLIIPYIGMLTIAIVCHVLVTVIITVCVFWRSDVFILDSSLACAALNRKKNASGNLPVTWRGGRERERMSKREVYLKLSLAHLFFVSVVF